jgi:succinate dehydrogenase / fumarate reductase membrane anchor subunit
MKVFTLLAVLSLAAHAWIGMWGVVTDYLTERLMGSKGNVLRIGLQLLTSLALVVYVIWAVQIIWS